MKSDSIRFLKKITSIPSPSGFEQRVQEVIRDRLADAAEEVRTDIHGNVIASVNPGGRPRIMISGHCDEIGFMVTHIDERGYIHFAPIGGVDPLLMNGLRVNIHTQKGPVLGVVGRKPIHHQRADDQRRRPEWKLFWIDVGAKSEKQARKHIENGDPITYRAEFEKLMDGKAVSRGFDDKIGAFIVTETVRSIRKNKLQCALFSATTVQEEIGLRGARTSAFGIDPDIGIAVDVGFSSDFPDSDKRLIGDIKLGGGPILYKGANINPVVGSSLIETARKEGIPFHLAASPGATGTDANAMQVSRQGVATALISIPTRYGHTPVEVISLKDVENTIKLLTKFLETIPGNIDLTP